jgi:hypothetical protein
VLDLLTRLNRMRSDRMPKIHSRDDPGVHHGRSTSALRCPTVPVTRTVDSRRDQWLVGAADFEVDLADRQLRGRLAGEHTATQSRASRAQRGRMSRARTIHELAELVELQVTRRDPLTA